MRRPTTRLLRGTSRRARWRRVRIRRGVSALLVGVAAWVGVNAMLPEPATAGRAVVVAARDLPVGTRLSTDDLRVARWPADLRPHSAVARLGDATGAVLSAPVARGEAVSSVRLRGSNLLSALPSGLLMAHIPVTDPAMARVVQPGDHVDALSTADGKMIGSDLLVLATGASEPDASSGMGAALGDPAPGVAGVFVAATPAVAAQLASTRGSDVPGNGVMLALRGPG